MLTDLMSRLFGKAPDVAVARELAKRMGASVTEQAGTQRINGAWNGMRCQVILDGKTDQMTVTVRAGPQNTAWEIRFDDQENAGLTYVSTQVALTASDATRMERLPMKVRLHVIEVVEAGRGSIRLDNGQYTLKATRAGLSRPNAAAQAAIRLDVMADLVKAAAQGF